jgi:carboxylesterase type B
MLRPVLALSALLAATSAGAASYSATLSAPASGRLIARDIVWNCGPAACQGSTEESRPLVLCQSLAKRAGRIDSFIVNGRAFTGADLERCNASAKREPASALASQ